jgi:GNAT superfamily N-acetyltransferase
MAIVIREASEDEIEALRPLLLLAEPSESALNWSLENLSDAAYSMTDDGQVVGAATMRWNSEPCEIMELGIASERQRQGLGKLFVNWVIEEARRRGKREIIVGTANSSIDNIAFYQRCGFRIDHVRKDYFWYHREPIYENGIRVRDMLVFSMKLRSE